MDGILNQFYLLICENFEGTKSNKVIRGPAVVDVVKECLSLVLKNELNCGPNGWDDALKPTNLSIFCAMKFRRGKELFQKHITINAPLRVKELDEIQLPISSNKENKQGD